MGAPEREATDPDGGEAAVSTGLQARSTLDETGAVIELAKLLLDASLPQGVSRERTERELYERKVTVLSACSPKARQIPARRRSSRKHARLAEITSEVTP